MGPQGPQGIPGPKGEPGTQFDTMFHRPDLWEVGKEYDFGDGLFGRRFTGAITFVANQINTILLGNFGVTTRIQSSGGWLSTSEYHMEIKSASFNDYLRATLFLVKLNIAPNYAGDLVFCTISNTASTNSPYDLWIKYLK